MTASGTSACRMPTSGAENSPSIPKMKHAFKTPGLREITLRGPYMHDGSLATLEGVVEHYDRGGVDRPSRSDP